MSVPSTTAPERITIADIDIPFWRMVAIILKWSFASIPAVIVLMIIFGLIGAVFGVIGAFTGHLGGMHI